MNVLDLVKTLFDDSGMTDEVADNLLWSCTGYPSFFTGDPARCLCYQLRHAKRSLARGFTVDDVFAGKDKVVPVAA